MRMSGGYHRGAVLVIVLWVVAMLGTMALGLSFRARVQSKRAGGQLGKVQSLALSRAAIERVLFELERDDASYDAYTDAWGDNPELFDHYRLTTGSFTVSHRVGDTVHFGATDEQARLHVNAGEDVLRRLLENLGISPDLADPMLDWMDSDHEARYHGAEGPDYAFLAHPYVPRNDVVPMLEELLLVRDMHPETLATLEPHVTVHGDGKVNVNTAGPVVLEALGLPADLVAKISRFRLGLDGRTGTDDDGVFRNLENIVEDLETTESLSTADRYALNNATGLLTVQSGFFRILARATAHGGITTRVEAVVQRHPTGQGTPSRIVSWKEI